MRWKLTLEYDGIPFAGWQRQESGIPTVQQAVETAFQKFCQQDITVHVAGRTDAGVHARGQVAHADVDYGDRPLTGDDLAAALNAHLRPLPLSVLKAEPVSPDFHARFHALRKLYTYRVVNRTAPLALEEGRATWVKRPLDIDAMRRAAAALLGHHDFTTFRDSDCQAKSPMKTLDRLDIEKLDDLILIHAQAQSFLHHQVRNMAGTLLLVGKGRWTPGDVAAALAARDRTKGGPTAPASALYLMRVDYP